MQRDLNPKVALAVIALILIAVGALIWWKLGGSGGQLTAAQAGLGKPMHPGEIPGRSPGIPVNNR